MKTIDFNALAKTLSNELLLDALCNQKISEEEHEIYMNEIKSRGIEKELSILIKHKADKKNKLLLSVNELTEENLFNVVLYNIDRFSVDELITFKKEIERRGLSEKLSEAIDNKETEDAKFREAVYKNTDSLDDLVNNFNNQVIASSPQLQQSIKKAKKRKLTTNLIAGVVLIIIGAVLSIVMDESRLFYGAMVVGIILIVKGLQNNKAIE